MSKLNITRLVLGLCVAAFATRMIGCNTTEGAGKDIKAAGNGIENAADRNNEIGPIIRSAAPPRVPHRS